MNYYCKRNWTFVWLKSVLNKKVKTQQQQNNKQIYFYFFTFLVFQFWNKVLQFAQKSYEKQ